MTHVVTCDMWSHELRKLHLFWPRKYTKNTRPPRYDVEEMHRSLARFEQGLALVEAKNGCYFKEIIQSVLILGDHLFLGSDRFGCFGNKVLAASRPVIVTQS